MTAVKKTPPKKNAAPPPINYKDLAPADEYFGPLKLSILGIKNTTSDTGKRYLYGIRDAESTVSTAGFIDAAVHDWARKYPRDLEVARAIYFLQRLYAMVDAPDAQSKAKLEATWMFVAYGSTPQAKQLRRVLVNGPTKPIAPMTPPPDDSTSTPAPEPSALSEPTPTASPAPGAVLDVTPTPAPSPHDRPSSEIRLREPEPSGAPAPVDTSPADGFAASSATPRGSAPTPIPTLPPDVAPLAPTPIPTLPPTPIPTLPPTPIPTLPPTPAPARSASHGRATPAPAYPTDTPFPSGPPPVETPYPSQQGGAPTPFPTPIQPSAQDIDGTPAPQSH